MAPGPWRRRRPGPGQSQLAHLKRLQARGRANRLAQNGRGILVGDFFDLHAAGSAGHDDRRFDGAVHQDAEVQLALDVQALFDQQALHQAAFRAGLRRDQRHAQNLGGELLRFVHRARQLDAAALAAPAGVNLRLHHHDLACPGARRRRGRLRLWSPSRRAAWARRSGGKSPWLDIRESSSGVCGGTASPGCASLRLLQN